MVKAKQKVVSRKPKKKSVVNEVVQDLLRDQLVLLERIAKAVEGKSIQVPIVPAANSSPQVAPMETLDSAPTVGHSGSQDEVVAQEGQAEVVR